MKANHTPAARGSSRQSGRPQGRLVESITIKLTADQARRLRFIAHELDCTPESVAADAVIDQVECFLESGSGTNGKRDEERNAARRLNRCAA